MPWLGVIPGEAAFLTIIAITCLHIVLNAFYGGRVYDVLDRVGTRSHDIRQYRPLFETIAAFPPDVPLFAKLHAHMGKTPREPLHALAGLMRLVRFANLRRDGLFGVPYYLSQLFVLTDFHVLSLMERWQQQHGPAVRRWLEGVGRTEAISSLATLAHDNPHWSMPVVDERPETTIVARQLGHPLIADDNCKRNDVEVGPAGTFVLVTGSNMSGKSTLLRAVGLNIILAQAGAPVCAERAATAARPAGNLDANPRLARGRRLLLHGRAASTQGNRRPVAGQPAKLAPMPLPARRNPAGHQLRRASHRRLPHHRPPDQARLDRHGLDARSGTRPQSRH